MLLNLQFHNGMGRSNEDSSSGPEKLTHSYLTIIHPGNGGFHFEKEGEVSRIHCFPFEFRIIFCRCVSFLSSNF